MVPMSFLYFFFFFKQKTAYEVRISDWSSDVCSSDLQLDGARIGMAHAQHVGMHGVQRHRRVDQRLTFLDGAGHDRHVDDVAAEPLAGELDGGAGAGRVLEEEIDDRPAAQDRKSTRLNSSH